MELFKEIVNDWEPLTMLTKSSILDVRLGSEYMWYLSLKDDTKGFNNLELGDHDSFNLFSRN